MEGNDGHGKRGGLSLTEIALHPRFRVLNFVGRCRASRSGATVLRDVREWRVVRDVTDVREEVRDMHDGCTIGVTSLVGSLAMCRYR